MRKQPNTEGLYGEEYQQSFLETDSQNETIHCLPSVLPKGSVIKINNINPVSTNRIKPEYGIIDNPSIIKESLIEEISIECDGLTGNLLYNYGKSNEVKYPFHDARSFNKKGNIQNGYYLPATICESMNRDRQNNEYYPSWLPGSAAHNRERNWNTRWINSNNDYLHYGYVSDFAYIDQDGNFSCAYETYGLAHTFVTAPTNYLNPLTQEHYRMHELPFWQMEGFLNPTHTTDHWCYRSQKIPSADALRKHAIFSKLKYDSIICDSFTYIADEPT